MFVHTYVRVGAALRALNQSQNPQNVHALVHHLDGWIFSFLLQILAALDQGCQNLQ